MRSSICPRCRHANFSAAVACKRCGYLLAPAGGIGRAQAHPQAGPAPPKRLGILLAILGAALSFAGVYLLLLGGRTPYFVVAGIGIAVSGVLIASGKLAGVYVYFINLGLMLVWSIAETGGNASQLIARLALATVIGLYLLSDKVRGRLS
ncbi:MAG TPA: hypothetical protein VJ715_06970 [Pyrinomonadaceae bacterium]|nr:hypothetical protein [Pyrinomonadaceae bacterium]